MLKIFNISRLIKKQIFQIEIWKTCEQSNLSLTLILWGLSPFVANELPINKSVEWWSESL